MKIVITLIIAVLMSSCAHGYPVSDHYNGSKFTNPEGDHLKSFWDVIKWKWSTTPAEWPKTTPNANYKLPLLGAHDKGILTFVNHATFLIQLPGLNVLTDPLFSERASPLTFMGPKRAREPGISFEDLPAIHVVLISHNHYDHLDIKSLERLDGKFHPLFIVPLGNMKLLKDQGIQNVIELDWWQDYQLRDTKITFAPSMHWSARGLFDKNETLWGSFMIDNGQKKIYFAGDTGLGSHFLQIKSRLGAPDIALLPIGAYLPRDFMKPHHMNPQDAVQAHLDLGSAKSIGMHFGTFQLTDEGMEDPVKELAKAREEKKISEEVFRVLDQGQSHVFN
jgi:L-ascorbate metabolism protein UlaG (beta-lactamase superfamily)